MSIPQTFIHELIARADVVEIIGRYVQLKKGGANFMGLCPFHSEKSPSFSVSPSKQFFHCFGCGKSGDAIAFLMEHTGATFHEAVEDLAQQYGMQVPEDDASPQDKARAAEQRQKQSTLTGVLEQAGDAFRKQLKNSVRAVDYLKGRGLSGEVAKQFGLGYAPQGWRNLASVFPNYDDPLLAESGLVITNPDEHTGEEKRYDRFRDRIMFPIRNVKGECIGFGGRVLGDEKPKYLNSPETPVFSKGRELYGLFEARNALRDAGYVLVTEGYMDVVALAQLGFPNTVATLGTACTPEHVQKLFRFTDAVVFSFDGDAAGRRAARKALDGALPFASDVRSVKFLFLPPEHDPDSYIRAFGRDAFARYVAEATPLSVFLVEAAREGCDLNAAEGRAHFASNAKPLWNLLPEGALKRQLLGDIADLVQLNTRELTEVWLGKPASSQRRGEYGDFGKKNDGQPRLDRNGQPWRSKFPQRNEAPRPTGRLLPASRADHAVRLLLSHAAAWDKLGNEDHAMLCELPGAHGGLFVWLESQLHEHGPQPWGMLSESLRGQPFEPLATKVMARPDAGPAAAAPETSTHPGEELAQELRNLLDLMLVDRIKSQMSQLVDAVSKGDAEALKRYQELSQRLSELARTAKAAA
ncbi:DNA primase [Rhodoferax koreense]|uniref:DNA primase n=1 Tax=Rhodoferax koreensis TaxID=1842727 RepID=A0A1P8JY52_9BURK|nr:DNA primase [Rhodoferax koreense]APW38676.1 DNA primase [Rhodoferax koreense]